MKRLFLFAIKFYQKTLSLDHGPLRVFRPHGQCCFYPTCSQYMYEKIERYGILKGVWMGMGRVLRCHPWGG